MKTDTPSLDKALLAAQRSIAKVGRDGENRHQRYKYTTSEHMLATGRAVFHEHDILVVEAGSQFVDNQTARFKWRVVHADSGEAREIENDIPVEVRSGMPRDKALFAASTMANNYMIRGLLQLPRVEGSEEPDARDDTKYAPPGLAEEAPPANRGEELSPGKYKIETRVLKVTERQTKNKKPFWVAEFECGWSANTFTPEHGDTLTRAAEDNLLLEVRYTDDGKYKNLESVWVAKVTDGERGVETIVEAVEHHEKAGKEWWIAKTQTAGDLVVRHRGYAATLASCVNAKRPSTLTIKKNKKGAWEVVRIDIAMQAEGTQQADAVV